MMVKRRIRDFFFGEENLLDTIFRVPPKKPDSRMYFLGGCGLITIVRGFNLLFGRPPQSQIFQTLGPIFLLFWGWIWVFIGFAVMIVAGTGHWKAELDRAAAFLLMGIWWVWALLYFISSLLPQPVDLRLADLLSGSILAVTGLVLSAGIIQGIRKTQEIRLKNLAVEELKKVQADAVQVVEENQRLRLLLLKHEEAPTVILHKE